MELPAITPKNQGRRYNDIMTDPAAPTTALGSLFIIPYNGLDDGDEMIPWHNYRVSRRSVHYLDQVMHSHPETLASFSAKSAPFQSFLLKTLAQLVYAMKTLTVGALSEVQSAAFHDYLDDLAANQVDVSWLKTHLTRAEKFVQIDGLIEERDALRCQVEQALALIRRFDAVGRNLNEFRSDSAGLSTDDSLIPLLDIYDDWMRSFSL